MKRYIAGSAIVFVFLLWWQVSPVFAGHNESHTPDCQNYAPTCVKRLEQCKVDLGLYEFFKGDIVDQCIADKDYWVNVNLCGAPAAYTEDGVFKKEFCQKYGEDPGLIEFFHKNLLSKMSSIACEILYDTYFTACAIPGTYEKTMSVTQFVPLCSGATGILKDNLTEAVGYGKKPSDSQCQKITVSFASMGVIKSVQQVSGVDKGEHEKCVKELNDCALLIQACSEKPNNPVGKKVGQIDIENINLQCETYLKSVGGKWKSQAGVGLCAQMLNLDAKTPEKCEKYKEEVEKLKTGCVCPGETTTKKIDTSAIKALQIKACCTACKSEQVILNALTEQCPAVKKDLPISAIKAYPNPIKSNITNPQTFIGNLIKTFLGIVGSVALALVVYGGFLWMTSAGNAQRLEKGKKTVIWAMAGLVIIFISYALLAFIFNIFG